jgi:hypothetical protein
LRERAVKPAMEPKVLGTRISLTSWPALNIENSSWFLVSRAKIVTRSASTRSRTLSLMSTRMSWMLAAELIMLAISMSRFRYDSSRWVPSATARVAMRRASSQAENKQ